MTATALSKIGSSFAYVSGDEEYRRERAINDRKAAVTKDQGTTAQEHMITGYLFN